MAFTDDFNRADSADLGNDWSEQSAGAQEIASNQVKAVYNATTYNNRKVLRPGTEDFENGEVRVEFVLPSTLSNITVFALIRVVNSDANWYAAYLNAGAGTFYLARKGASLATITSQSGLSISSGVNYRITVTMDGSSIDGELYNIDTSSVVSTLSGTDATYSGAGKSGFTCAPSSGNDIYLGNFYAASALTVKSVTDTGAGADAVTVSQNVKQVTDTGAGSDSVSIQVSITISETGTIAEDIGGDIGQQLVFMERFDGTLSNWTLDETGGTASIQTVDNDEKLVLDDTSASGVVSATRSFNEPSGVYMLEADMQALTGGAVTLQLLSAADAVIASVSANLVTNEGSFDTDGATSTTFTWNANQYKMICLKVDKAGGTIGCFYSATSSWTALTAKAYSATEVAKVRFITDSTKTGQAYVDEVRVYKPDLFAIGDSNTAGHADTTATWNPNPEALERSNSIEDETHDYTYKLGQKYSPAVWVANRGVDGNNSTQADARIQGDVIDQGAERCIIMIGTNEGTLATAQTNIDSMISKLKAAGATGVLCSIPPKNGAGSTWNTYKANLNSWIQTRAGEENWPFADVHEAIEDPSTPDTILAAYDAGDGLHFNSDGLQAIADTVYRAIEAPRVFDTASGSDSISVSVSLALSDSGAGDDGAALFVPKGLGDSGQALDAAAVVSYFGALLSDTGTGRDSVCAVITSGAALQDVYNLVLTRLSSADYTPPDNGAITDILARSIAVSKWKDNKLARTAVEGRVETWVLFDDDGETPLLTWTNDTATFTRSKAT